MRVHAFRRAARDHAQRSLRRMGRNMLSSTLRSGTSVISWNAVWMPSACAARGERSAAGLPCTHSRPALGSTSPTAA